MKLLKDMQTLKGQLEHISISDFRNRPGEVFAQVSMGKVFVVERNGRTFAQICPAKPLAFEVNSVNPKHSTKRKTNANAKA